MGVTSAPFVLLCQERQIKFSKWLMKQRSSTSATSTTGTARVRSIYSSSEMSATLSDSTSPRRLALLRDRLMRRERSSPSTTTLLRRGNIRRLPGAAQALRQEQQRHHDAGRARQHPLQPRGRGWHVPLHELLGQTHWQGLSELTRPTQAQP